MPYTPLTDPFIVHIDHDGILYDVEVTYSKSQECCENFFSINILQPAGITSFHLKEKPTLNPDYDHMVWTDENNKVETLYQELGYEIEQHLRKNLNVFLIDSQVDNEDYLEKE